MKKIIILLMGMILVFSAMSCSVDVHDDLNEKITESKNTESSKDENKSNEDEETPTAESKDEDDTDESKDDSEKEDEESPKLDESSENTETNEPKEDTEVEESKDEDDSEKEDEENNTVVENITWCEIDENTNILELNYFVCVDGSQTKLNPDSNNESKARKYGFRARAFISVSGRLAVFNVEYKDGKLNFSDNNIPDINKVYTITDVTMEDSTINVTIEWK